MSRLSATRSKAVVVCIGESYVRRVRDPIGAEAAAHFNEMATPGQRGLVNAAALIRWWKRRGLGASWPFAPMTDGHWALLAPTPTTHQVETLASVAGIE